MSRVDNDRLRAENILIPTLKAMPRGAKISQSDLVLLLAKQDMVIGTNTMASTIESLIDKHYLVRLTRRTLCIPDQAVREEQKRTQATDRFTPPDGLPPHERDKFFSNHLRQLHERICQLEGRLL